MVPLIRTVRVVVANIRAVLGAPKTGAFLLAVGALLTVGASLSGLCPIRLELGYVLTSGLAVLALCTSLSGGWARMAGRIFSWICVVIFSFLLVPDLEDVMINPGQGLSILCGVLAAYFLLCAIALGFKNSSRIKASLPDPQ